MICDVPRSTLFVPASRRDLFMKAAGGAAEAICLDLEDGVDAAAKAEARKNLAAGCQAAAASDKWAMVRINSEPELFELDLEALPVCCDAVILPKVRDVGHLNHVAGLLEQCANSGAREIRLIGLIEDAKALLELERRFDPVHSGVLAVCPGTEDIATALGCDPDSVLILSVFRRVAVVASAMDVALLGFPGSIADFTGLEKLRSKLCYARQCGARGALAIHPAQIKIINQEFSPSIADLEDANRVIDAYEAGLLKNRGAIAVDGKMVDFPVYKRAVSLVGRMQSTAGLDRRKG